MPSKNTILVEIAPVQLFDPFETITLINFIAGGGKLLLASDFGTGSELTLLNNLMSNFFVDPLKETLYDIFLNFTLSGFNSSKIMENPLFKDPNTFTNFILNEIPQASPRFSYWVENNIYSSPIYDRNASNNQIFWENLLVERIPYSFIVDDIYAPYNDSVDKIIVTQPTPLSLGIDFGIAGWENLLNTLLPEEQKGSFWQYFENFTGAPSLGNTYETTAAILEMINDQMNISTIKVIAKTSPSSWVDTNANYLYDMMDYNGSFWIAAMSANGRVIITTQPQIFTNLFAFSNDYDNSRFALNLINELANNTPHFIVFDESKQQKVFPSFFGLILRFLNASSGILLLIPVLPLLTYATLSRWIPKIETPKMLKKSKVKKKRGKSLFSERMKWYKQKRQYNRAIRLLYRRLKRSIVNSIELRSYDPKQAILIIRRIKPNIDINRLERNLTRLERIEKNLIKITNQGSFLQLFNEMRWCYDQIK